AGGEQDGVAAAAGDPQRRMRLLLRFGDQVARRHREEAALVTAERLFDEQPHADVEGLLPLGALQVALDAEAAELGLRARLASAEFHPSVGDQVEGGDAFRHPGGVVISGWKLDDAVAEADATRALAGGGQEDFGGGAVRVLLEEVVLDFPDAVKAK